MKPLRCSKCRKLIKPSCINRKLINGKAYLSGKVVCQRCFSKRNDDNRREAVHWKKWLSKYYTEPNWGDNSQANNKDHGGVKA